MSIELTVNAPIALAEMGRGFTNPVYDAQQVFRSVLDAMARPGSLHRLPTTVLAPLQAPALQRGLAAVLLTLLDAETSVALPPAYDAAAPYLRFHTGVRLAASRAEAMFAVQPAEGAHAALWHTLADGTDEAPHLGATLIVEVPALQSAQAMQGPPVHLGLRGPGIRKRHMLSVEGLSLDFWRARIGREADFPRGIDLLLLCGDTLAAIPRSTRLTIEEA